MGMKVHKGYCIHKHTVDEHKVHAPDHQPNASQKPIKKYKSQLSILPWNRPHWIPCLLMNGHSAYKPVRFALPVQPCRRSKTPERI